MQWKDGSDIMRLDEHHRPPMHLLRTALLLSGKAGHGHGYGEDGYGDGLPLKP